MERRFAASALVFALLAAQSYFGGLAEASDPVLSPHEAGVLDRIFANWKARHDRVHSLHLTWDSRTTHLSGKTFPLKRIEKRPDFEFEQLGVQVFVEGDQRYCKVDTPIFNVPQVKPTDTRRIVERWIIDGDTTWLYRDGARYEKHSADPEFSRKPFGIVSRTIRVDQPVPDPTLQALCLTFRPQFPNLSWRRDQCRLVDEHATIDGVPAVKIQRVIVRKAGNGRELKHVESLWVSPVRDDVVVHWSVERVIAPILLMEGAIRYKKDPKVGWVPSEWTWEIPEIHNLEESRVTAYAINEKIDPSVFSPPFPPGTPVQDLRGRDKPDGLRHYVVEPDGSKRAISLEDFFRLSDPRPFLEKKPAAKPQEKPPAGK
ncbi:MAG TPA: hypothetical protein VG055_17965 [Planctomycetaceae bacterium]|jgi:hypothetical protein|nr:hypothetical protein [Planctomycetaceae bacterium]